MTLLAPRPELASMSVIVAVAGGARHVQTHFARRTDVTARARKAGVGAPQGEACRARMVEARPAPIGFIMAILTGRAVATLMRARVLIAVTRNAGRRQAHLPGRLNMTGAAFDRRMPAAQRKARGAVIEASACLPSVCGVAIAAGRPKTALMRIVVTVALHALRRRSVIPFVGVTENAACPEMGADQGKLRPRVIIAHAPPAFLVVTGRAARPQPPPMRLVRTVAIHACAGRVAILASGLMARRARHPGVRPAQWIIGRGVIESARIKADDIRAASFVIGMADPACFVRRPSIPAVKTGVRPAIRSDRTMALRAQPGLLARLQYVVTGRASALQIGVPGSERPRRNQPLDHRLRVCDPKGQHSREHRRQA